MSRHDKTRATILGAMLLAVYLLAALVEPCDGHSCANDSRPTITE